MPGIYIPTPEEASYFARVAHREAEEVVRRHLRRTDHAGGGSITVAEIDGAPDVSSVTRIEVTNGKLTDDGSGQVTLDLSGQGSHATSHEDGGSDEVTIENLPTGETDTALVLLPDGAGGLSWGAQSGGGGGTGSNNPIYEKWDPDAPPASAGSLDDEFDDASGGVPTGWTEVDHGSDLTVDEDDYGLELVGDGSGGVCGIYKSLPAGDWTVWTKLSLGGLGETDTLLGGLALWEDATDSAGDLIFFRFYSNSAQTAIEVNNRAAYNSSTSTLAAAAIGVDGIYPTHIYMRIRYVNSSTTYAFDVSSDGVSWLLLYSTSSLPVTPTHVGPALQDVTGSTGTARFDFFRSLASNVGLHAIGNGQRVPQGGGTEWLDAVPSGNAPGGSLDDEFADDSLSGWTSLLVSGSATWTEANDVLSVLFNSQTAGDVAAQMKSIGSLTTTDYIETACRALTPDEDGTVIGLFFSDGTTGAANAVLMRITLRSGTTRGIVTVRHGTLSTINANVDWSQSVAFNQAFGWLYFRLTYAGANSFTGEISPDGVSWTSFGNGAQSVTLTPTHMGMFVGSEGGTVQRIGTFEYFRTSVA